MDLFRKLVSIYKIYFIINLYLIYLIGVQTGLNLGPRSGVTFPIFTLPYSDQQWIRTSAANSATIVLFSLYSRANQKQ
jgi:hypothetical protein